MNTSVNSEALNENDCNLTPDQLPVLTHHLTEAEALAINGTMLQEAEFQKFVRLWCDAHNETGDSLSLVELFGAYYCQEASRLCAKNVASHELLLRSLNHYTVFLQNPTLKNDIRYFAQWQMGLVMERLCFPWPEVEKTLLAASPIHEGRGEATRHVIQHYRAKKAWTFGYLYSTIAIKKFHEKIPTDCKWFIDPSFYTWKVMYYHADICSNLRMEEEMMNAYRKILPYVEQHPEEFTKKQIKFFQQFKN
ncbi:hypothetical protein [Chitinophaga filiformis]|uniref:DNA alkylation repair enzyme n=1 Tax=Chitinophaga filiformis TaxID=104663 RepID=A0ABY4HW77_CHIFI|nr:hypothetical protein [Chitinophaga filiformis]UPK68044.1 hypothetical protein MYF79_24130 [Chitinophaga filiformis]